MTRASVKAISGYAGINPPRDVIDLRLDHDQVYLGSDVTGSVRMTGHTPIKSVHLRLEGIEYSIVALPEDQSDSYGIEALRKKTAETRIIFKKEQLLDCAKPQLFKFFLPEKLPSTMKCRIEDSNPTLPSQCRIKYTVSATIYGNSSKTQVAHTLLVVPKEEVDTPITQTISLCIKSNFDLLLKRLLACGDKTCVSEDSDIDPSLAEDRYITLEPSPNFLRLVPGQLANVFVQD